MVSIGKLDVFPKGLCEINWRVPNFFSLPTKDGLWYYSPGFSFAGESWNLMIYPNGRSDHASTGYIGVYIWRQSFGRGIHLEFSFGLKTLEGVKKEEQYRLAVFETTKSTGIHKFVQRSKLLGKKSELVPDDHLTIFCTLREVKSTEYFGKYYVLDI